MNGVHLPEAQGNDPGVVEEEDHEHDVPQEHLGRLKVDLTGLF